MKITVFGSTGRTGEALLKQALEKGYEVTTVVRSQPPIVHEQLTVIRGDLLDIATVTAAMKDSDAVISVVGFTPKLFGSKTTDLYSRSAAAFTEAMAKQKIQKLIFCTSAGVEDDPHELWLYRHVAKPLFLQKGYENMQAAEKIIAQSDTDWILVRPGRLTNGKLTTHFRVSERFRATGGYRISRADVAFFILQQVTDHKWVHKTPTLTY